MQGERVQDWLQRTTEEQEFFTSVILQVVADSKIRVITIGSADPRRIREAVDYAAKQIKASIETRSSNGRVFIIPK